jgi:hypothetical protein
MRGADRESSRTCGGMRWTRELRLTSVTDADGEDVWSWRPKLAPSLLKQFGGRRSAHRGERAISGKPLRRESRMPPLNLYARVRFLLLPFVRETAGAARIRLSLRPLVSWGVAIDAKLGRMAPRGCEVVFVGTRYLEIESADIYPARMRYISHAVIARQKREARLRAG